VMNQSRGERKIGAFGRGERVRHCWQKITQVFFKGVLRLTAPEIEKVDRRAVCRKKIRSMQVSKASA
jgi:hypothetical protein